jgi:hypothetical protein
MQAKREELTDRYFALAGDGAQVMILVYTSFVPLQQGDGAGPAKWRRGASRHVTSEGEDVNVLPGGGLVTLSGKKLRRAN